MTCSMELLNFLEECEKPAPTLCFDIMELVGTHVETIRKNREYKNNYNGCIKTLKTIYSEENGNLFECWMEDYMDADCWFGFLTDNSDKVFVRSFYENSIHHF